MMCQIRKERGNYALYIPHAAEALRGQAVTAHIVRDDGKFKVEKASIKRTTVGTVRLSLFNFKDLIRKKNTVAVVTIVDPDNVIVNINPMEDEIWVAAEA